MAGAMGCRSFAAPRLLPLDTIFHTAMLRLSRITVEIPAEILLIRERIM